MARRVNKDDERIENVIRRLLKQPENRRCINCNSLGPQYVCTTFWTFVCTICSGVHREFSHRVKSVSMAKFREEEITALQAGGNERAREIYLKTWDPQCNIYPDGSNLNRLREFVKHVYIDRKYTGENKQLTMVKLDSRRNNSDGRPYEKNEFPDRSSTGSRDDPNGRSSFEQSSPFKRNGGITFKDLLEERSPQSSRNRSVTRFEIVDDRFRDEGSVKRYDRRSSSRGPAGRSRSPVSRASGTPNLPAVQPVKEILGEKVPALKIGGPPKYIEKKNCEVSAKSENAADATIPQGPSGTHLKQNESLNPSSLIDFEDKPEPTHNPPELEPPKAIASSENDDNGTSPVSPASHMAPNNANSLENLLFGLFEPVSYPPSGSSQVSSAQSDGPNAANGKAFEIVQNDWPLDDSGKDRMVQESRVHQPPPEQEDETSFNPRGDMRANAHEPSNNSPMSNDLRLVESVPLKQPTQVLDQGDGSKATSRKEIPQDLFTSNFVSLPPAAAGWQVHLAYDMGFGVQYHPPATSTAALYYASRPKNPFDTGDDGFQTQVPMFPSMSSLQEGLPSMAASTGLISQPSPYARSMPPHVLPSYGMNVPLGPAAYMVQPSNNMPQASPQASDFTLAKSEDAFASLDPIRLTSGTSSSPIGPNSSFPRTGNPFG